VTIVPIEEQLRWERRARGLLQWASVAAVRSTDPRQTLADLLAEICRTTGWPIGHALQRTADGGLESMGVWHLDDPERYRAFRAITQETRFAPGVGLPGRVLAARRPHWIVDVLEDDNFPRSRAAHVDYVTKPFQAEEVLARLRTQLDLYRVRRDLQEQQAELEREPAELLGVAPDLAETLDQRRHGS
jgi:hypothetical protein